MNKIFVQIFGVVFILVGILGLLSNRLVGVSGFFHTGWQHDLVHLGTGILFLLLSFLAPKKSSITLKTFGAFYFTIGIIGFVLVSAPNLAQLFGLITINAADNWLHCALGIIIFSFSFIGRDE